MGLQWAYRGMREEKVEKEKAFTMEQSMPLQAEKGSSKERTESELFCLGKRWLGRDGSIQPTDYHIKKSIEEVEEEEIKLCCSK